MILRHATMADRDLLLQRRDDLCSSHKAVTDEEHDAWMVGWIEAMKHRTYEGLYIAEVDGVPVGTGRITLDIQPVSTCKLHYQIAPPYLRKGFGTQLVTLLVAKAKEMGYRTIKASIHRENRASLMCALMGGVNAVEFL